ncbi:hypothetical protein ACFL4H_00145 [Candidatus Neomarinimicrobiota bacterium]
MKEYKCKDPEQIVKMAFYIAWVACGGPLGMGMLQDNPTASIDDIWENVSYSGNYPGDALSSRKDAKGRDEVYGDYVFGRMMKLRFKYDKTTIYYGDYQTEYDVSYNAFAGTYPNPLALLDEAKQIIESQ